MNGLLSMIGVVTRIDYQMDDFPFGSPSPRLSTPKGNIPSDKQKCQPKGNIPSDKQKCQPKGNIPSDKQKCQPKTQHEFTIKGVKIMAASKKDAIKKFNHLKK